MFRDDSFVKNKDAVSRYKMALEAYLNKNSGIVYKSVDTCNASDRRLCSFKKCR